MNVFHSCKKEIEFNGKKIEVSIDYAWEYEVDDVEGDFDFGNEDENRTYLQRFRNGELECVSIRVQAHFRGLTGSDYLGMNHIKAGSTDDMLQSIAEHCMVENAIDDLGQQLTLILKNFE